MGERVDLVGVGAVWEHGRLFDQVLNPGGGVGAVVVCVIGVWGAGEVHVSGFDLGADGVGADECIVLRGDWRDAGDVASGQVVYSGGVCSELDQHGVETPSRVVLVCKSGCVTYRSERGGEV